MPLNRIRREWSNIWNIHDIEIDMVSDYDNYNPTVPTNSSPFQRTNQSDPHDSENVAPPEKPCENGF